MFDWAGRFLTGEVDCAGHFLFVDEVFPRASVMRALWHGPNGCVALGALLKELSEKRVWLCELKTGAAMPIGVRQLLHTAAPVARASPSSSGDDCAAEGERLSHGRNRLPDPFNFGFSVSK